MSDADFDARALAAFGQWLGSLADDTRLLARLVADPELGEDVRRPLAAALNYLFKSLDLIDDGIEGLGFLDDAFVLRVAASHAPEGAPEELAQLREDVGLLAEFLGELAPRLERFVRGLDGQVVRGRSVDAVVNDEAVRQELLADLSSWASRYEKPVFAPDPKNLVKLRAFLAAKLPA